jgi:hypothetical protein
MSWWKPLPSKAPAENLLGGMTSSKNSSAVSCDFLPI